MLLDPLEEQFDLPAAFVKGADGQRRQVEVVAQEGQPLAAVGAFEADAAQMIWIVLRGVKAVQRNGLVANQASALVHRPGVDPVRTQVRFGAGYKRSCPPGAGHGAWQSRCSPGP